MMVVVMMMMMRQMREMHETGVLQICAVMQPPSNWVRPSQKTSKKTSKFRTNGESMNCVDV